MGRQPAIGLAELESLYGAQAVQPVGGPQPTAALVDVAPEDIDFDRLGGSTKFAKLLIVIGSHDWRDIDRFLVKNSPEQASLHPEGKLTIGLSAYGLKTSIKQLEATGLSMKKAIKKHTGRSVRLVPNKELEMNTAQVLHNGLTKQNGWELVLVRDGSRTILAQTISVQDIESYTVRDRERPKRDTRVGMLPPKLAQILINLSVGRLQISQHLDYIEEDESSLASLALSAGTEAAAKPTAGQNASSAGGHPAILDPFCGTGVVLQEALLTGYGAYGSDIDPRMVDYTTQNLQWLHSAFAFTKIDAVVEQGDATNHQWTHPFSHVASEAYLGRPFTSQPSAEVLTQTISECNLIIKKFLRNIRGQIPVGTRLCIAIPAWQVRPGSPQVRDRFKHLPIVSRDIDQITDMGYNRISFEHAKAEDLLYYRADQIVARELLVLVST